MGCTSMLISSITITRTSTNTSWHHIRRHFSSISMNSITTKYRYAQLLCVCMSGKVYHWTYQYKSSKAIYDVFPYNTFHTHKLRRNEEVCCYLSHIEWSTKKKSYNSYFLPNHSDIQPRNLDNKTNQEYISRGLISTFLHFMQVTTFDTWHYIPQIDNTYHMEEKT